MKGRGGASIGGKKCAYRQGVPSIDRTAAVRSGSNSRYEDEQECTTPVDSSASEFVSRGNVLRAVIADRSHVSVSERETSSATHERQNGKQIGVPPGVENTTLWARATSRNPGLPDRGKT